MRSKTSMAQAVLRDKPGLSTDEVVNEVMRRFNANITKQTVYNALHAARKVSEKSKLDQFMEFAGIVKNLGVDKAKLFMDVLA